MFKRFQLFFVITDLDNSWKMISNGSLFPIPAIYVAGSNELITSFANPIITLSFNFSMVYDFFNGYRENIAKKSLVVPQLVLNNDFTFFFWYKVNTFQIMKFSYGKEFFVKSSSSSVL